MTQLTEFEGVGEAYEKKLKEAGVASVEDLLEKGATPKGRKDMAAKSGINETLILKWVNHADLFRIKGIGSEYAELLEVAGVDTVVELAQRNADNLCQKMVEINEAKKLVRKVPVLSQVADWVSQAKLLPKKVNH
jgi:predicted flap endonuclease-1-like 5' DNA nuclease